MARLESDKVEQALRECLNRVAQGKAGARCESMRLLAESLMNASELAGNPS